MPRTPIIVTLADGKDHLIVDGEITGCGQIVPPNTPWNESTTKPCKTCFPDGKVKDVDEASTTELVEAQQEAVTTSSKPTTKATKSGKA